MKLLQEEGKLVHSSEIAVDSSILLVIASVCYTKHGPKSDLHCSQQVQLGMTSRTNLVHELATARGAVRGA